MIDWASIESEGSGPESLAINFIVRLIWQPKGVVDRHFIHFLAIEFANKETTRRGIEFFSVRCRLYRASSLHFSFIFEVPARLHLLVWDQIYLYHVGSILYLQKGRPTFSRFNSVQSREPKRENLISFARSAKI